MRVLWCGHLRRFSRGSLGANPVWYGHKGVRCVRQRVSAPSTESASERTDDRSEHRLSLGTLYNQSAEMSTALEPFEARTREWFIASPVVHFDESGVRVNGALWWRHSARIALLTAYTIHPNRGQKGMEEAGILARLHGNRCPRPLGIRLALFV